MQTKLYDIKEWCQHGYELENYPYIGTIDGKTDIHEALKVGSYKDEESAKAAFSHIFVNYNYGERYMQMVPDCDGD